MFIIIAYVHYSLVHLEEITHCTNQAKPLLLEIEKSFLELKKQSEDAYNKQLLLSVEVQNKTASIQKLEESNDVLKINLSQADSRLEEMEQQDNQKERQTEDVNDRDAQIEKLKTSLNESASKMEEITAHFESQLKTAQEDQGLSHTTVTELQDANKKLTDDKSKLISMANQVTQKLEEANTKLLKYE